MSRPFRLVAHRPASRVTHAARVADSLEAITACGRSLGTDYSVDDHLEPRVTCRSCRKTGAAL